MFLAVVEERGMCREGSVRARRARLRVLSVDETWCLNESFEKLEILEQI